MESQISAFLEIVGKLDDLGDEFQEHKVVLFLLRNLPEDYNVSVSALEARPESDLILEMIKEKLMQKVKRKNGYVAEQAIALKTNAKKKGDNPKCYSCGKCGHIKRNCSQYQKKKKYNAN